MTSDTNAPETIVSCLGKSFIATTLAVVTGCVVAGLSGDSSTLGQGVRSGFFLIFVGFLPILIGWVLALPGAILLPHARGVRFWALLVYGFLLGPIVISVFTGTTQAQGTPPIRWTLQLSDPFLLLGAGISAMATLSYLFLIRRTPAEPA